MSTKAGLKLKLSLFLVVGGVLAVSVIIAYYMYIMLETPINFVVAVAIPSIIMTYTIRKVIKKLGIGVVEVELDFLYMLLHMLLLSTGKAPSAELVNAVSDEKLYKKYAKYFKKIHLLVKEYGYSLPTACSYVSKEVREKYLKDFLERFASVITVGEDMEPYLEYEFRSHQNMYEYVYGRIIDSLRVLMGSYTAVMTSAVFIVINFLIFTFFFGGDVSYLIPLFWGIYGSVSMIGFFIYKLMPKDPFLNKEGISLKLYRILNYAILVVAPAIALITMEFNVLSSILNGYVVTALAGALLIIPGIMSKKIEGYVYNMDKDFPIFAKMYSANLATIPSLAKALEPMLVAEFGKIAESLKLLHTMLRNNIRPTVCFRVFSMRTGSEIVRKGMKLIEDSVKYGADMSKVGQYISEFIAMLLRTRRLRLQVFKTFESSVIVLHAAGIILMSFTVSILGLFAEFLARIPTILPFAYPSPALLSTLTGIAFVAYTVINAVVLTIANGGLKHTLTYYLGILTLILGIMAYASSYVVDSMIGGVFKEATQVLMSTPSA